MPEEEGIKLWQVGLLGVGGLAAYAYFSDNEGGIGGGLGGGLREMVQELKDRVTEHVSNTVVENVVDKVVQVTEYVSEVTERVVETVKEVPGKIVPDLISDDPARGINPQTWGPYVPMTGFAGSVYDVMKDMQKWKTDRAPTMGTMEWDYARIFTPHRLPADQRGIKINPESYSDADLKRDITKGWNWLTSPFRGFGSGAKDTAVDKSSGNIFKALSSYSLKAFIPLPVKIAATLIEARPTSSSGGRDSASIKNPVVKKKSSSGSSSSSRRSSSGARSSRPSSTKGHVTKAQARKSGKKRVRIRGSGRYRYL